MQEVGLPSNKDLERATGIDNTVISRWRSGETVPKVEQLRKLERALDVPLLELLVRAGHLSPDEAESTSSSREVRHTPTGSGTSRAAPQVMHNAGALLSEDPVMEAIRAAPGLLPEARAHLLQQYQLLLRLQAATAQQVAPETGVTAEQVEAQADADLEQEERLAQQRAAADSTPKRRTGRLR